MQKLQLFKVLKISMYIYDSHVGGQKNAHQPITYMYMPVNEYKIIQLLLPITLFSLVQMTLNLILEQCSRAVTSKMNPLLLDQLSI